MRIPRLVGSLFLALAVTASAWSAAPPDDFKALMRKTLDAWETLDPANAAPFYAKDPGNVYFDVTPLKYTGWAEYAEGVKKNFPDLASVKFTLGDDVRTHQHGNVEWATATLHFDLGTKAGATQAFDGRWTVVWEKRGREWLIVHEHVSAPLTTPAPAAMTAGQSLYKRLGGYDALAAVTSDFMARMMKDPQLGKYFLGHSTDSMNRVRQLFVEKLCEATGGPCVYIGRSMSAAHAGMGLSNSDWDLAVDHLIESMTKFNVPDKERDEVLALVASLKNDIVPAGSK